MAAHTKPMMPLPIKTAAKRRLPVTGRAEGVAAKPVVSIAAAKAKTHLLQLLDEVERDRNPVVITKRGRVVAHLVPAPIEKEISNFDKVFGSMKGTVEILGDIVSPDWESWGPEWR